MTGNSLLMSMRFAIPILTLLSAFIPYIAYAPIPSAFGQDAEFEPDEAGYRRVAVPFLTRHCQRCHGPDADEGDFRVDQHLKNDFLDRTAKGKWGEVVNVLNSHEMPPEDEPQPRAGDVVRVVDWITQQMARAELFRRDSAIVLRRLNRAEYRNTIRDLIGVDFDPSGFPQDSPAGGFDNNGGALTISPLHLELYFNAARKILDRALVEGDQPPSLRWRFEVDSGDSDSNRVTYDGQRVIVNGGKSRVENGFKVIHHASWNLTLTARDFALPHAGEYVIRIRAAGTTPDRDTVVEAARGFLNHRRDRELEKQPDRKKWLDRDFERDLEHFRTDPMYDYGPPRLKLNKNLGGQPSVVAEFDVNAPVAEPKVYEVRTRMSTLRSGLTVEYAYDIPKELENFWMQGHDEFARPELWVDWFEIEGPVYESWPPATHTRILFGSPDDFADERAYAREVIARFMRRAYRRVVADDEIDEKLSLYDLVRNDSPSFVAAIKTPLSAVLVSPHFLYLAEPAADPQSTADPKSGDGEQPPAFREFTSRTGTKITAKVLGVSGTQVTIEREDGKRFTAPVTLFSEPDRQYLLRLARPAQGPRDFRDRGGNVVRAKLIGVNGDKITIARASDGREFTLPMSRLSDADQQFILAHSGQRKERRPSVGRALSGHELASRLSYFLWSSMPDEELLAAAGRLTDPEVLAAQVDRLLADNRSAAFIDNFAGQWLGLREVGSNPPAPDLYPRYDRHLEISIVEESKAFFSAILNNDLSVMRFVESDFVVINERLGRFYGIPGVRGDEFRRVKVPRGVRRGGVVTQASVLSITSNGTRTSPVKRGTWVMKNILGLDPGLPVANAGEIAPKVPGIDKATVRKRLEIHRSLPQCARCHNKIDPLGFALENFNAAGQWREQEGFGYKGRIQRDDPVIDASSKLPDGTEVTGVDGLQKELLKKKDLFLGCLAGKMFTYALGRELGIADQLHVKAAVKHLRFKDDSLRSLIKFVVMSEPFGTK